MQAENIEFRWNSTVTELVHGDQLTGVRLKDVNTGVESLVTCDAVFVSVGRKPATELVKGKLELDKSGYVVADETTKPTSRGVCRGRRADQGAAPGGDGGGRRRRGGAHGGGISGGRSVK